MTFTIGVPGSRVLVGSSAGITISPCDDGLTCDAVPKDSHTGIFASTRLAGAGPRSSIIMGKRPLEPLKCHAWRAPAVGSRAEAARARHSAPSSDTGHTSTALALRLVHDHGSWVSGDGAASPKPPGPPTASPRPHFLRFPHAQTGQSTHRTV